MSPFTIQQAHRGSVRLLAAFSGPPGGGKTLTALKFARGLAGPEGLIVLLDTEESRSQIYADVCTPWQWIDFQPPFGPDRYIEALKVAEAAKPVVIVVDSMSHEYEGEGGLFDLVEAFLNKRAGDDARKRGALSFTAWDHAKSEHKKLLLHLLRMPCHVVLCLRAQDKIELIKEGGQLKAVPKKSLTGLDGWIPICEKRLPFYMTCSFLLLPDRPGVPRPLKQMPESMVDLWPLDRQVSEQTGRDLAQWADGGGEKGAAERSDPRAPELVSELLTVAETLGARDQTMAQVAATRRLHATEPEKYVAWLQAQLERGHAALTKLDASAGADLFPSAESDNPPTIPEE